MGGLKVATSMLKKKLRPGQYKVEGYWGGYLSAEHEFTVKSGVGLRNVD